MKKIIALSVIVLLSLQMFAGGIVTNSNQSAFFVRMLSRNGSIGLDGVYYNPAGLVRLNDGFYLSLNNQTIFQKKTITNNFPYLNDNTYIGDVSVPVFPSFFAVYKKDKIALSFGFGPIGGGGSAEYKTGLPSFEMPFSMLPALMTGSGIATDKYSADIYFKGSSVFWGAQVAASYAINDIFSVSAGLRMTSASNTYQGHVKNIMVNPMHTLNPNGAGNMVSATLFFNGLATASYGAATSVGALSTAGLPNLETARDMSAITPAQYNQLTQGLGSNYVTGMPLSTVQAMYTGAGNIATANAAKTADMDVDATQSGFAITPYFGVNININNKLNIGIKYEFNTNLELTNKANADKDAHGMFKNDSTFRSDIPALLSIGVEYSFTDEFRVSTSLNHYFDKNADWNGKEEFINNNFYELSLGMEYDVNKKISLSAGYLYAQTGVGQGYQTDLNFSISSSTVGFGGRVNVTDKLSIDLGASFSMYTNGNADKKFNTLTELGVNLGEIPYKETYDKSSANFAIGVNYKF